MDDEAHLAQFKDAMVAFQELVDSASIVSGRTPTKDDSLQAVAKSVELLERRIAKPLWKSRL
jgi:hypothetical protein